MNKFTPGPWQLDWDDDHDPDTGEQVTLFPWRVLAGEKEVVDFYGGGEVTDADANLIAAAPDLYVAAEALLGSLGEYVRQSMYFNPEWKTGIEAVQAALAKARGETKETL